MNTPRTIFPLLILALGLTPAFAPAGPVYLVPLPASHAAGSNLITWHFAGEVRVVQDVFNRFEGGVVPGTPFSGSFTFDLNTPDSDPDDPTIGVYESAIVALSGTIGDFAFTSLGFIDLTILNDNGPTPRDRFVFEGDATLASTIVNAAFGIVDADATIFSSDALPLLPPLLATLDPSLASFGFNSQEQGVFTGGRLTHLVPEPGTLCLLGMAVYAMMRTRARRRRRGTGREYSATSILSLLSISIAIQTGSSRADAQGVCGCMDLVFIVDVTGSFSESDRLTIADQLRSLAENSAQTASGGHLRLGLITFGGNESPPIPLVVVRHTLTSDTSAVLDTLDALLQGDTEFGGGPGSLPEPSDQALCEMLDGCCECTPRVFADVPFRGHCIKHAILITDNLPEGCAYDGFECPKDKDFALGLADLAAGRGIVLSAIIVNNAAIDCSPPIVDIPCTHFPPERHACVIMDNYAQRTGGVIRFLALTSTLPRPCLCILQEVKS